MFNVPGWLQAYVDGCNNRVKCRSVSWRKSIQSTKIIMILWIQWNRHFKPAIKLDAYYVKDAEDLESTANLSTEANKPFNSLMSDIKVLTQCVFAHIKIPVENSWMFRSAHLHINFHKLASNYGSSYHVPHQSIDTNQSKK